MFIYILVYVYELMLSKLNVLAGFIIQFVVLAATLLDTVMESIVFVFLCYF